MKALAERIIFGGITSTELEKDYLNKITHLQSQDSLL